MVFGGRLGDLFGMRRVFLVGAVIFGLATTAMGASQDIAMAIAARALQGAGAALMMPTALAIVSAVYPDAGEGLGARHPGRRLGLLRRPRARCSAAR